MSVTLESYKRMLLLRVAEEEIAALYLRNKIMSFVHFYVGQEAVAVGISDALKPTDRALGNHRSHGHYLAKGGDLRSMLCELLGKAEGSSKGKGGSMHMIDKAVGFTGSTPILGSITSIAAGSAFAQQYTKDGGVTVAYIGDGASEEGGVYETMNLAALYKLPLLIVVENNLFSVNSSLSDRRSDKYQLSLIAEGLGVTYVQANGNDYTDVRAKAEAVLQEVRSGKPAVLECVVYRHMAHSAPIFDEGSRKEDTVDRRLEEDCIRRARKELCESGLSESELDVMAEDIRTMVQAEIAYAEQASFPDVESLYTDVYA